MTNESRSAELEGSSDLDWAALIAFEIAVVVTALMCELNTEAFTSWTVAVGLAVAITLVPPLASMSVSLSRASSSFSESFFARGFTTIVVGTAVGLFAGWTLVECINGMG